MKKILSFVALLFSITLMMAQTEICGNGLDDDGDGYVDGYDPDCVAAQPVTCFAPASASTFGIQLNVQSPALTIDVSIAPTVGDIDGDGKVEIMAPLGDSSQGYIVYEVNGTTITQEPYQYNIPLHQPVSGTISQPAIADVNRDGTAEIICVGQDGHVYVFNYTGGTAAVYRARSNLASDTNFGSPRVADIDEDGRPEIIVGNDIFQFNAAYTSLTRVVQGSNTLPIGRDNYVTQGYWGADIVVVDILPGNPGKEIVAGSVVYGVNLVTGTISMLKNLSTIAGASVVPANSDGPTAVADLDGDGDLDIVYSSAANGRVYAWDPQNNILLLNVLGAGGAAGPVSEPTIAYVYDDTKNGYATDLPEVIITTANTVTAYNLQFPPANSRRVWQFTTSDSSGETGITAFDFNGDGVAEMIYNDQTEIRIINGNLATPANLSSFASGTITWMEHPIVADVDGDGQAEMIAFSGLPNASSGQGRVNIFNPTAGNVWQPARKVWNQRGYHIVNINDDLTVPITETKMTNFMPASSTKYKLLNQYNVQFNPDYLKVEPGQVVATDAQINSTSYNAANSTLRISVTVGGNVNLPASTPITIYNADPRSSAATVVQTVTTPSVITVGSTVTLTYTGVILTGNNNYVVINDNGSKARPFNLSTDFPSTGTPECNYVNNLKNIVQDSDGDGVGDDIDLDNDNDGILDIDENCNPFLAQNVSGTWKGKTSSNLSANLPGSSSQPIVAELNDTQIKYHINQSGATTRVAGSGNISYTYTFSTPVPANEIAFYIEDLDPQFGSVFPTYQINVNGGAANGRFRSVTYGGSNPYLDFNSSSGALTVADRTIADYRVLLKGQGNQLVTTITITSTGITGGDAVAYSLFALNACDTDGDGIPNYLDLDSDNDGCPDAVEGGGDISNGQLVNAGGTLQGGNGTNPTVTPTSGSYNQSVLLNLCASGTCVNVQGVPQLSPLPTGYSNTTGQTIGDSQNALVNACYCYKKPVLNAGVTVPTRHGITALNRANSGTTDWPVVRQSAWTVLESKTKGFVVNRVAFNNAVTPPVPVGIAAANFVEGMMVYDTTNNCLKIYNGTAWNCYTSQACPQ